MGEWESNEKEKSESTEAYFPVRARRLTDELPGVLALADGRRFKLAIVNGKQATIGELSAMVELAKKSGELIAGKVDPADVESVEADFE